MQYIEELSIGDCFEVNDKRYILCADYKKNGDRLSICLSDGNSHWMSSNTMVDIIDIFTLDDNNNIIAIKKREKYGDSISQNTNIS